MVERFPEEQPTPTQTLNTFVVAGEMFLSGKNLALKNLNSPPYLPGMNELADHLTENNPDSRLLTEWQRSFLAVNGLVKSYNLMTRRAHYQEKYMRYPALVKQSLLNGIQSASDDELKFDPSRVDFKWSLFSVALVAQDPEFEKAVRHHFGKERKLYGFVSRFATELGRLPIVLKDKDYRTTIWHEDIHVWQEEMMGYGNAVFSMSEVVDHPAVQRAAFDENIEDGDIDVNKQVLEGVLTLARREMRVELPAALWSRELPFVDILETPDYKDLAFVYTSLLNCIYSKALGLTEEEQVSEHFDLATKIADADLERQHLIEIAREAVKRYRGPKNKWERVAAITTVMPPDFSTQLYQEVMLGRHGKLEKIPEIKHGGYMLASVLATHSRRKVHPEPYGQGGQIPKERVRSFLDETTRIFNERTLFVKILDRYRLGDSDLAKGKQRLIQYASKSVPEGFRGKTERELKQRLSV